VLVPEVEKHSPNAPKTAFTNQRLAALYVFLAATRELCFTTELRPAQVQHIPEVISEPHYISGPRFAEEAPNCVDWGSEDNRRTPPSARKGGYCRYATPHSARACPQLAGLSQASPNSALPIWDPRLFTRNEFMAMDMGMGSPRGWVKHGTTRRLTPRPCDWPRSTICSHLLPRHTCAQGVCWPEPFLLISFPMKVLVAILRDVTVESARGPS
jgi:hypothetical protein